MDLSLPMVCFCVFASSLLIILTIVRITMREKTYEELLEERNKQFPITEFEPLGEEKNTNERKKKKKGKGKLQQKRKPAVSESDSDVDTDVQNHKMVELELESEIIEPEPQIDNESEIDLQNLVNIRKRKKDKNVKAKSILINKDEQLYTTQNDVSETFHPQTLPKDEVELQYIHRAEKTRKKRGKPAEQLVERDNVIVKQAPTPTHSSNLSIYHSSKKHVNMINETEKPMGEHFSSFISFDSQFSNITL